MPIPRFAGEQLSFTPPGYLFFGDNLEVLPRWIGDESVDLIYLDPPFNSNKSYNLLFEQRDGTKAAGQIKAFDDTWRWSIESARVYDEIVAGGGEASSMIRGVRAILGTSDMLAYITMMTPRLIELRRVLKSTGSVYLHCDPNASHYLKVMMDAVFGAKHFQNEVIWYYKGAGVSPRRWGRRHDTLLWYSKGSDWYFDPDPVRDDYAETTKARFAHYIGNKRGDADYGTQELNPRGKHPDDVWQIPIVAPSARARRGYPTQKPVPLLERVILSSSAEGQVVLDPFCGCGTTIEAAQRLNRHWIGIDITEVAITEIRDRLGEHFGQVDYVMGGEPGTREEAEALARLDKHEFQRWACEKIGITQPVRKGADRGIDGEIVGTFDDATSWRAIVSVKGGKNNVSHLRDLSGTVTREGAYIGVLVTLNPPTRAMNREAADAGFTETGQARLQVLTVDDLVAGKQPDLPPVAAPAPREERHLRAV